MKKYTLAITLTFGALTLLSQLTAAPKYGQAGCGLGSIWMGPTDKQIFAATSNGTFGSQTFGISSGTSNCTPAGVSEAEQKREIFVHMNFDSLEQEMAVGRGEKLSNLATLFECSEGKHFQAAVKANYDKIFTDESKMNPSLMLSNLHSTLQKDATVKNYCKI